MIKVMAFGTFDHFHAGHESYLKQARALGDELFVVVARNATVKSIKGRLPDHTENERVAAIKSKKIADKVMLGSATDKYAVIGKYKPNILALGYDQFAFTFSLRKFLIDKKMDIKIVRLKPYKANVYKTTIIRQNKAAQEKQ